MYELPYKYIIYFIFTLIINASLNFKSWMSFWTSCVLTMRRAQPEHVNSSPSRNGLGLNFYTSLKCF